MFLLAIFLLLTTGAFADGNISVVDLQAYSQTTKANIRSKGGRAGVGTLTNLNPTINVWFVLGVTWTDGLPTAWHLENTEPRTRQILLDSKYSSGLVIMEGNSRYPCDLFTTGALEQARASNQIYAPLCGGRLYLRNPAKGARTALESATEFLRNQVWGGEAVISIFHQLLAGRYRDTGDVRSAPQPPLGSGRAGPQAALVDGARPAVIMPGNLGIASDAPSAGMVPGAWYATTANPAVYVSVLQPGLIAAGILKSNRGIVGPLDSTEASSLCYLIAFDLDRVDLGFALGTDHPAVNWSPRVPAQVRDLAMPGPDGIGNIAPLVATGLLPPASGRRTIATFTGGFKREHGAFRSGDLSLRNHGSHYGFIENGVVLSKLQPGLATVMVLDDGAVDLKTWSENDNRMLPRIRHARQNGVPLVELDEATRTAVPGRLVPNWGAGNWSGSETGKLRTIRAGLALQSTNGRRFLIYAVFSSATPAAMARIFQAYGCVYAMQLDMNALEHTYLSLLHRAGTSLSVEHLIKGMDVLDKDSGGQVVPRFLGYPDNRDFFYVMERPSKEAKP